MRTWVKALLVLGAVGAFGAAESYPIVPACSSNTTRGLLSQIMTKQFGMPDTVTVSNIRTSSGWYLGRVYDCAGDLSGVPDTQPFFGFKPKFVEYKVELTDAQRVYVTARLLPGM